MAKQKLGTESCKEAAGNEDKQPWSLQVDCKHVNISAKRYQDVAKLRSLMSAMEKNIIPIHSLLESDYDIWQVESDYDMWLVDH